MLSRENVKLFAVAVVAVVVSTFGPTAAQAAYDAVNSDRVDGKDAVGANATVTQRKGKLVATSPTTGRLPNNIIKTAPNANKLDGVDSSAYRFISLDPMSVNVTSATQNTGPAWNWGLRLPDTGTPVFGATVMVPPDFKGTKLKLHLLWHTVDTSCTMGLLPNSSSVGHAGKPFNYNGSTYGITVPTPLTSPATSDQPVETVVLLSSPKPSKTLQPLDVFGFSLYRDTGDSCASEMVITGMWVTY